MTTITTVNTLTIITNSATISNNNIVRFLVSSNLLLAKLVCVILSLVSTSTIGDKKDHILTYNNI